MEQKKPNRYEKLMSLEKRPPLLKELPKVVGNQDDCIVLRVKLLTPSGNTIESWWTQPKKKKAP